jgi:hypothetical protein
MTQTFVCPVGTSSRTSLIRPPSVKGSKYLFVTEMEAGSPLVGPVVSRFGTRRVQLRGRLPGIVRAVPPSLTRAFEEDLSNVKANPRALRRHSGQLTMALPWMPRTWTHHEVGGIRLACSSGVPDYLDWSCSWPESSWVVMWDSIGCGRDGLRRRSLKTSSSRSYPIVPRHGSPVRALGTDCIDLSCGFCESRSSRRWHSAVS